MRIVLALVISVIAISASALAGMTSVYTEFNIKKCKVVEPPDRTHETFFYGSYLCDGYGAQNVFIATGQLRTAIAFGKDPQNHCAATQSFDFFNDVVIPPMEWRIQHGNEVQEVNSPKIEWRLKDGKPIATIIEWRVMRGYEHITENHAFLVVTSLTQHNSCRVAVVDRELPSANERARKFADKQLDADGCALSYVELAKAPATAADISVSSGVCFRN